MSKMLHRKIRFEKLCTSFFGVVRWLQFNAEIKQEKFRVKYEYLNCKQMYRINRNGNK